MYLNTPRWKAYNHVWTLWVQRLTCALGKQFRALTYRNKQTCTLLGSVLMFHSSYLPLRSFAVLHVRHSSSSIFWHGMENEWPISSPMWVLEFFQFQIATGGNNNCCMLCTTFSCRRRLKCFAGKYARGYSILNATSYAWTHTKSLWRYVHGLLTNFILGCTINLGQSNVWVHT